MARHFLISALREPYRRAGLKLGRDVRRIEAAALSAGQLATLEADANLRVEEESSTPRQGAGEGKGKGSQTPSRRARRRSPG